MEGHPLLGQPRDHACLHSWASFAHRGLACGQDWKSDFGWGWGRGAILWEMTRPRENPGCEPGATVCPSPRFCLGRGWGYKSKTRASARLSFSPGMWSDWQTLEKLTHQEVPVGVSPRKWSWKARGCGSRQLVHTLIFDHFIEI